MGKKSRKGGAPGGGGGGGAATAATVAMPLQVGDACLVHSLVAGDHLNGATGTVVKVDPEDDGPDGRVVVGVAFGQGNREKKRIRRRNLRPHAQALTWGPGQGGMGGMNIFGGVSVGGASKKKAHGAAIARCTEAEPWKMTRAGNTCIGTPFYAFVVAVATATTTTTTTAPATPTTATTAPTTPHHPPHRPSRTRCSSPRAARLDDAGHHHAPALPDDRGLYTGRRRHRPRVLSELRTLSQLPPRPGDEQTAVFTRIFGYQSGFLPTLTPRLPLKHLPMMLRPPPRAHPRPNHPSKH